MFAEQPTQYDLRWRMFGIDVRVQPLFWLVALITGWPLVRDDPEFGLQRLSLWVALLFVSILIHELGHVCMGRFFGSYGSIVLHGFGGLAIGSSNLRSRWQRVAVYLAGPFAGFFLVALLFLGLLLTKPNMVPHFAQNVLAVVGLARAADLTELSPLVDDFLFDALFINIFWGLINLLPIWPLDGGQVAREVCAAAAPRQGERAALSFSIALAVLLALHAFLGERGVSVIPFLPRLGGMFTGILFAMLAFASYQELQRVQAQAPRWRDRDPWR